MEKPLKAAWVGLKFGWGGASGNIQGGPNSVSQSDRISDVAPAWQLCGSLGGGLRKGTMASTTTSVWNKVATQLSPWCFWCLSICSPHARAQRESVQVSLCMGPLSGTSWDFWSSWLPQPQSLLNFTARCYGHIIFLTLEPWAGEPSVELGPLSPEISILIIIHHT